MIYRGQARYFIELPDGTILIGIETDYMRLLDVEQPKSAVRILEIVFLKQDQCVIIKWTDNSKALQDVDAISMLMTSSFAGAFDAGSLLLQDCEWVSLLAVWGFAVRVRLAADGKLDCDSLGVQNLMYAGTDVYKWSTDFDVNPVTLSLDTPANVAFATYMRGCVSRSAYIKSIGERELANALNKVLEAFKVEESGGEEPSDASKDVKAFTSECSKSWGRLGSEGKRVFEEFVPNLMIMTKEQGVDGPAVGPGWAGAHDGVRKYVLNGSCGLKSLVHCLTALARIQDGAVYDGVPCDCAACKKRLAYRDPANQ